MEWQLVLLLIFGSLIFLMAIGTPVAFAFLAINTVGVLLLWGGGVGLGEFIYSIFKSVSIFILLPLPMFILMGEVMFHSGIAPRLIDAIDRWLGHLPGRLGVLAIGGGTLFAVLTGTNLASIAMLGSTLVPEMEKRGYKKQMSLGPIMGGGALAPMIPPSTLAILLCAIGQIAIGKVLIAIIIPGLLMAVLYVSYVIVRCWLQPSIAPAYEVPPTPLLPKLIATGCHILPVGFVVFLVTGVIILGIATPTEAAATGALGMFILAAIYGRLNWEVAKKSISGTMRITVMMFMIIAGAFTFSQILAFTGSTRGLVELVMGMPLAPVFILIGMQVIVVVLGMFMEAVSIMMIVIPLFMPIINTLGLNPVWFAVIYLINTEVGGISPPFGLGLFTMKGVAPADTTMGDIYKAAFPFILMDLAVMALLIALPIIALWLPSVMR